MGLFMVPIPPLDGLWPTIHRHRWFLACFFGVVAVLLVADPGACQGGYDTTEIYKSIPEKPIDPQMQKQQYEQEHPDPDKPENANENRDMNKKEPFQESDVQKWFDQYDDIRGKYETTPKERQYLDMLMARPPQSGLSDDDQKFVKKVIDRYHEALDKMKEVEVISETERLHGNYMQFLVNQGNMYEDYYRLLTEPNPRDQGSGRPLGMGMQQRKRQLQTMERANAALDLVTRQTFHIDRNPFLPKDEQQPQYQ